MALDSTSSPASMKRSPLTPIAVDGHRTTDDPKLAFSPSYPSFSRSHSDDELRQRPSLYQRRKSSVPGLTLTRPSYHRRRSHNRRSSPARGSPAIPASLTPIHPSFVSKRRTSLPALHFHDSGKNVASLHITTRMPQRRDNISEDMYGALKSFTFGAPPFHSAHQFPDNEDEDEDERHRRDRAKMRAIDDGTRRPSLPTNPNTPTAPRSQPSFSSLSSGGIVVGERQWDEHSELDWDIVMGDITPTKTGSSSPVSASGNSSSHSEPRRPSVPIAIPMLRRRSRSADELAVDFEQRMRSTTPTQTSVSASTPLFSWVERAETRTENTSTSGSPEEDPTLSGFNLQYIFNGDAASDTIDAPNRQQAPTSRLRYRFRSKPKKAVQTRFEDSFMRHIMESDPVHKQRQAEWTFRREAMPARPTVPVKGKEKERFETYQRWRCEWVGSFDVYRIWGESRPSATASDPPKGPYNRLQIMPARDPNNKGNKAGGPRALVHRHSKAEAFSIFRAHYIPPKHTQSPNDSILLAVKHVLQDYTRTESTSALNTHGLTDDGDSRSHQSRSGSRGGSGRARGTTLASSTHNVQRTTASSSNRSANQPSETRPRTVSTRGNVQPSISRPTTASSISTSRPSSLALTESSHSLVSSNSHYVPPVSWDPPSPKSPRLSTSHAEAFAMIDPEARDHDLYHNNGSFSSTRVATSHGSSGAPSSTTPSPPSRSSFGFFRRAFSSKPQHQQKEPASPVTDEGEDEPKTANQDGKFAPPWLTVAHRSEKEQHDRMIRTLNNSFESVGLIPPQKKSSKPRPHKGKKDGRSILDDVPDDSMAMLLPLWPDANDLPLPSLSQSLSRHSSSSAHHQQHNTTHNLSHTNGSTTVPLQERRFLLVYYAQFDTVSDSEDNGGHNNKKRRRPQTAGERPQYANPAPFYAAGRLLTYDDVRSSGVRLPEKGVSVNGPIAAAAMAAPSRLTDSEVIAYYDENEDGVLLDHDGLVKLGLMESQDENAKLSEVGRAIVEMVWMGSLALKSFPMKGP